MKTNRQFAAIRRSKQLRQDRSEANAVAESAARIPDVFGIPAEELKEQPLITLSTLARAMGPLGALALARMLAGHKHRKPGPRRSYQRAREQAISLLSDGTALTPDAELRAYEREAVTAMQRARLVLPSRARALRAYRRLPPWEIGGVLVSMHPDVEVDGARGTGAAKIILTKDRLARGVGTAMATLLWHYRRNVLGIDSTRKDHCLVFEPRLPWLHLPSPRTEHHVRNAELACKVITALWATV